MSSGLFIYLFFFPSLNKVLSLPLAPTPRQEPSYERNFKDNPYAIASHLVCIELMNYNKVSQKSFLVGSHALIYGG